MGAAPAPVHYLRPNERDWSPAAVIGLDTETRVAEGGDRELLALRLWAAHYVDRRAPRKAARRDEWADGDTPAQLAAQVNRWFSGRKSVWLFTHNLAFDLTTTRLVDELRRLGWRVSDAAIGNRSPWVTMGRKDRTLTVVDSGSWLPMPLAEIAARTGRVKPPLPGGEDDRATWLHRCRADVDVMMGAMLDLMNWWDRNRCGNWSLSGPATGWNAHRHIPTPWRVVMDPEPEKVAHDRLQVHGGRRQVWSVGHHGAGPFAELDFTAAYPTIAAHLPLPSARAYPFETLPAGDPAMTPGRWGVAARVRIATESARWPVRLHGVTWYPLGEFWADLAQPDIDEAARLGALREIGPGWCHQLRPHLADWARWCLDVQHGLADDAPEVARIACKNWGRTVIGRYAARSHTKTMLGPAPSFGWGIEPGWHAATGVEGHMLDIDGRRWWVAADGTPDNAYPAVLAWVEAEVRVRVGRAIDALGPGALLQCDTDGIIVAVRTVGTAAAGGTLRAPKGMRAEARLTWCLDQLDPVIAPLAIRVKRTTGDVTILGPQHVKIAGQRRFAGMPKNVDEVEPGVFTGHTWPKLTWQLQHGDPRGYIRPRHTYRVSGPYPTGWLLADGRVQPVTMTVGADGCNRIVPFRQTVLGRRGVALADVQHPALDALR